MSDPSNFKDNKTSAFSENLKDEFSSKWSAGSKRKKELNDIFKGGEFDKEANKKGETVVNTMRVIHFHDDSKNKSQSLPD